MKKFGRKLVLSGLALAATAATLSTSTYAWYVSNTSADVDGGTAATEGGSSSGNLLVAQNVTKSDAANKGKGAFSNQISLANTYDAVEFNPVTKCTLGYALTIDADVVTGTTYYELAEGKTYATATKTDFTAVAEPTKDDIKTYYVEAEWMDVDGKYVAKEDACQTVSFWVLSTNQSVVNIKAKVENTTTANAETLSQVLLNATGAPDEAEDDPVDVNDLFYVDAAKALRFEVSYSKYTAGAEGNEGTVATDTVTYDVDGFHTGEYALLTGAATGGDANNYYNAIMHKNPVGGATTARPEGTFSTLTVEPGAETLVTIKIWLEGTDSDCFDSCRNQTFAYSFDLTTTE